MFIRCNLRDPLSLSCGFNRETFSEVVSESEAEAHGKDVPSRFGPSILDGSNSFFAVEAVIADSNDRGG